MLIRLLFKTITINQNLIIHLLHAKYITTIKLYQYHYSNSNTQDRVPIMLSSLLPPKLPIGLSTL